MSSTSNTQGVSQNDLIPAIAHELVTKTDIDNQKAGNWPALSDQDRAFGYEYIQNGYDHRLAASEVGYSPDSGIKLKRRPYVAAFIQHLQEQMHESNFVVKGFIDARLDDLYDMAIGEVEVPLVLGDGTEKTAKKFHGGLALQILQERSKTHGIVKEEKTNHAQVIVNIDMGMALGQKDVNGVTIEGNFTRDA